MTDENNFTSPPTPTDPPKNEPPAFAGAGSPISDSPAPPPATPAEPEISAEKPVESETVRVKVEPVVEPEVEKIEPEIAPAAPAEPEITPVESTPAEPEIEKPEPEVESTSAPAEPETAPIEPVVEPEIPAEIPVEPEVEKVAPVESTPPVESEIEKPAESEVAPEIPAEPEIQKPESEIAQSEIIAGAPSRPGDKIEKDAPATPVSGEAVSSEKPADEKKLKTGFKPDGVTPLDGEEKMFSAIGYIAFLALLPLIARRDSEFAQHHGRQGLVLTILFIVLWMIGSLSGVLMALVFVLNVVAIVGGFVLAYKGDWFKIPGIYDLSLKMKFVKTPPLPSVNPNSQTPSSQNNLATNENEIGEDGEE